MSRNKQETLKAKFSDETHQNDSYVHPEVLVDTQWVQDHLKDQNVRRGM